MIPTLISHDRDAQVMELRMLGFYIRRSPRQSRMGGTPYRCVTDGEHSYPLRRTDDEAWNATIDWLLDRDVKVRSL